MVFGDVLYDVLVICSLHCSAENSPVLCEPGNHTTVVFCSNVVHLYVMLPTHIVPTIVSPTKLKRLYGERGGVNCDDI